MRYNSMALIVLAGSPAPLLAQTKVAEVYTVDGAHSLLDFTVRLVGFNRVRGTFKDWDVDFSYDPASPTSGFVSFAADIGSVDTQVDERDSDLKKPSFFDLAHFPTMRFEGHVVSAAGTRLEIDGLLTIKDSTHAIHFPMELTTPEATDPFGNRRLAFSGNVTLNRRDYGVVGPAFWNRAISDSVSIEMELAGRIWNYHSVGFGRRAAYYGPALVAAADSGRFDSAVRKLSAELAAEQDSTRFPTSFEVEVTVGRLVQGGKLREAQRVLELVAGTVQQRWDAPRRSRYETRVGEVLARMGRGAESKQHFDAAVALDSTNTNARAWRASVSKSP